MTNASTNLIPLSFAALRSANNARQAEWPGSAEADTAFRALEVAGEAGELCEAVKKLLRAERGIMGSTSDRIEIAKELGDLVIAADLLARELGIDLGLAVAGKFNATSAKHDLQTRINLEAAAKEPEADYAPDAQQAFAHWFKTNYPGPDTIIGNPDWHAPKIFRAVQRAIQQASK